jgi:hypothetical protein
MIWECLIRTEPVRGGSEGLDEAVKNFGAKDEALQGYRCSRVAAFQSIAK